MRNVAFRSFEPSMTAKVVGAVDRSWWLKMGLVIATGWLLAQSPPLKRWNTFTAVICSTASDTTIQCGKHRFNEASLLVRIEKRANEGVVETAKARIICETNRQGWVRGCYVFRG